MPVPKVFLPTQSSARFGAATSDVVNFGTCPRMADLSVGTLITWTRPRSVANDARHIAAKTSGGGSGFEFFKRTPDGTTMRFLGYRATSNLSIITNTGVLVVDRWQFIVATWDTASTTNCKIYVGDMGTPVVNVSNGAETAGSGTPTSASSDPLYWGNSNASGATTSWIGDFQCGAIWNRVLTLGEIEQQRQFMFPTAGCIFFVNFTGSVLETDIITNNAAASSGTIRANPRPSVWTNPARDYGYWTAAPAAPAGMLKRFVWMGGIGTPRAATVGGMIG